MTSSTGHRPTRLEVAPDAITANVARLVEMNAPAAVCCVVKADGYGHGAVVAARAGLAGGAQSLGVALVEEAETLRAAGVEAPILVLSEPPFSAWPTVVALGLDAMVYSEAAIAAAGDAAASADSATPVALHLKVDTGMHRVGCAPDAAVGLAQSIVDRPELRLAGLASHFATADDTTSLFPAVQLERFRSVDEALREAGIDGYVRHIANSAGAIALPASRFEMVRCGIACYGIAPSEPLATRMQFDRAGRLVSAVTLVKRLEAGEPVSYGCRYVTTRATNIVTVPIGYADGVPRSTGANDGMVLIGGLRFPVVGTVTMDQLMVDVGDVEVSVGDEVVLVGEQGTDAIAANEVAAREGTIGYEIVSRIGPRVPRVLV
ncbi:MAG: alanine racemase [Acidimicrobiales bacterium]